MTVDDVLSEIRGKIRGSIPASIDISEVEFEGAEPLTPVASFQFPHQAEVAVSFLESNGIAAIITGDDCGRADPILGIVTGGVRVMVRESQALEALSLLESGEAPGEHGGV